MFGTKESMSPEIAENHQIQALLAESAEKRDRTYQDLKDKSIGPKDAIEAITITEDKIKELLQGVQ